MQAVRGASLALAPGEVPALVGENGAGKSTLLRIADGMIAPDRGTIHVDGREVRLRSPRAARALGIGMVHQHFTSIDAFTVAENIALAVGRFGASPSAAPGISRVGLDSATRAGELSVALRQRLEILKVLEAGARVLLLDEPSAVLAPSEVEELLGTLRALAAQGSAIALVTHKLGEVLAVADRVTVLRHGEVVLSGPVGMFDEAGLAEAVIGGRVPGAGFRGPGSGGRGAGSGEREVVRIGEISLAAGEIVGIAAIEGNGQRALLRGIAGLGPYPDLTVQGPVAFVPGDRTTEGLIPEMSLTENLVLGLPRDPRWSHGGRLDWGAARAATSRLSEEHGIVSPGPEAPAAALSGGNQQKLILARALAEHPRVLVAEHPSRGLDVRATQEVHRRLREAAASGALVIVHSADLDEVLALGQRWLVMHAGAVREVPRGTERALVGRMMLGLGAA